MWIIDIISIILFIVSTLILESDRRKRKTASIHSSYFMIALFISSTIISFIISIITIKNNINNKYFDTSLPNILSLLFIALYIVFASILVTSFIKRYNVTKTITTEISEKFYAIHKKGSTEYKNLIFAIIDNILGYGLYSIYKGLDSDIKYLSDGYIYSRLKNSNINYANANIKDLVYIFTQHWIIPVPAFKDPITEEEFEVFKYCEKKLCNDGNIKPFFPNEFFEYHLYLTKHSKDDYWRQYETYLIDDLTVYFAMYSKYEGKNIFSFAKTNLCKKIIDQYEKDEMTAYLDNLILFYSETCKNKPINNNSDSTTSYNTIKNKNKNLAVKTIIISTLSICLVVSVIINICLGITKNNQIAALNKEIQTLNASLTELKESNESLEFRIELLVEAKKEQNKKLSFYEEHAVCVGDNSRRYHKYGCSLFDDYSNFWIYNIEYAEYKGYKPCSLCYYSKS